MEARVIDLALKEAYHDLIDLGLDESELDNIKEAREILRGLKEKTIEEVLGEN